MGPLLSAENSQIHNHAEYNEMISLATPAGFHEYPSISLLCACIRTFIGALIACLTVFARVDSPPYTRGRPIVSACLQRLLANRLTGRTQPKPTKLITLRHTAYTGALPPQRTWQ